VRIDDSLCGVKMLDLDLYLSASVNVRYILHTQPLRLYNKVLVWDSLYRSLSLSIFVGLSFSLPTPFAIVACNPFTTLILSYSISSTLTLPMAKDRIYNANDHSNDNTINPPPLD
jgi:hypothetical protein